MKILFVITQPASFAAVHLYVLELLKEYRSREQDIISVFFTGQAVGLMSKNHEENSAQGRLRNSYGSVCAEIGTQILCCGQAVRNHGLIYQDLLDSVKVSGNMELSVNIANADLVLEF